MPIVAGEVHRIRRAFRGVSDELGAAMRALRDLEQTTLGNQVADGALTAGLGDLNTALAGLQHTSDECQRAMLRHADDPDEPVPAEPETPRAPRRAAGQDAGIDLGDGAPTGPEGRSDAAGTAPDAAASPVDVPTRPIRIDTGEGPIGGRS